MTETQSGQGPTAQGQIDMLRERGFNDAQIVQFVAESYPRPLAEQVRDLLMPGVGVEPPAETAPAETAPAPQTQAPFALDEDEMPECPWEVDDEMEQEYQNTRTPGEHLPPGKYQVRISKFAPDRVRDTNVIRIGFDVLNGELADEHDEWTEWCRPEGMGFVKAKLEVLKIPGLKAVPKMAAAQVGKALEITVSASKGEKRKPDGSPYLNLYFNRLLDLDAVADTGDDAAF